MSNLLAGPPESLSHETPEAILRRIYGYDAFRGLQADVIAATMAGRDGLVAPRLRHRGLASDCADGRSG